MIARMVCCAGVALLAAGSPAQKDAVTGFGAQALGPFDAQAATGNDGLVGVVELNGELCVSARGLGGVPPHLIYVFDAQGQLLRQFNQNVAVAGSAWGYRDGTTDGSSLAFGWEGGIHVLDPQTGALVNTFHGQSISNPIDAGIGIHRGLAFDPNGDSGRGSFWTGSFASDLWEIDLQGNVLTTLTLPVSGVAWSVYGLAWDDQGTASAGDDTLWVSSAPTQGEIRELDPRSGSFTGNVITRDQATSAQGGLDGAPGLIGGNGAFGLVAIDQGPPDTITVYRVDRDSQNPGENEAVLLSGIGASLSAATPKTFFALPQSVALGFDLTRDPSLAGRPVVLIFNAGSNLPNTVLPGYPEVVAQLTPALLVPTTLAAGPMSFSLPPPLAVGDQVRVQAAYLEPRVRSNAVVATNQVRWERAEVVVGAAGSDSFNVESTSGFFSVTAHGTDAVVEVTLDWTTSSNPLQASQVFDPDQLMGSYRFDGGNSTVAGCRGTYRNGSDVAAGLIYDGANTVLGLPCDPTSNCGWIGSNAGLLPGTWRTLRFRFAPGAFQAGVVFEFDCDTDGGATGGDEMDGLVVTVKLQSGRTLGPAELRRVPGQSRALLRF